MKPRLLLALLLVVGAIAAFWNHFFHPEPTVGLGELLLVIAAAGGGVAMLIFRVRGRS